MNAALPTAWAASTAFTGLGHAREALTAGLAASGRALTMGSPGGLVKVIAHAETDRLLGVHICGANASELIAEAVVTMEFHGAAEDLATIVHAHPTMSEVVHEAALSVAKRAIHRVN